MSDAHQKPSDVRQKASDKETTMYDSSFFH